MEIADNYMLAQQSVIGSMLIDDRCVPLVLSKLTEDDFLDPTCRNFFRAICELAREGRPVDPVTVTGKLKAEGDYTRWSVDVMMITPTAANVGEYIDMTSRELEAALKERDAALKAAEQAKADQKAADAAREKLSADMALANERIAGLNAEVEAQSAKAREAQDAAARFEKELAELRSRPVEVAVEVDSAAVETARKEAEAAMQKKLDAAKKAQAKAEADKKAAENAKVEAQQALAQAKAEARSIREQMERAERRSAISANEDLVLFRTLFDQVQEQVNKLGGVLMKTRNKDPETAGPLQKALLALANKIKEVAEG